MKITQILSESTILDTQDVAESIGEMAEFSLTHNMYDSLSSQQIKMLKSSLQKYGAEDVAVTDKSTVFQVNSKSLDSLRRDLRQNKIQIDTQFSEAANPAQQAAIAVNMKKDHKKPKSVEEGSISDLLNQDPTSPKFNDHPGASQLKKTKDQNEFTGTLDSKGRFTKDTVKNMFGKLSPDAKDVEEGLGKDIKRLATGKDVKSRAGQEIAKSQDASMKGDTKTSKKHFDRFDKLDKLANKDQGVAEGKITLSTDPNWYGATVDNYQATGPVVNIPAIQLVGFEPDDKMNQPKSKANVEKILAGLKQGAKLPPLLVRKYKNGYQVLDGHHRFWAYKLSGVKSIPCQIVPDEDIEEISKQGVSEDSSESKSNVTSAITDFYKTQLSQSKPGKVENYNSKAKELLSQATGKQRAKVLTMLKAGSKNPYLQGVIITIVGSIVSGAVIKHFGSMGLSPQQFNMILQGSMNSIIPTLAAKLHGMSWSDAIKTGLASVAVGVSSAGIMEDNAEYDDESGMAHTNLHTIIRAAEGLLDTIDDNENLPEWVQEKIANVEGMIVSSWDYLKSQEEQGIDPQVNESNWLQEELNKLDEVAAWQKKSGKNKTGGLNQKGVNSYRREHPGSKLQTAVTTKPSKLKPGSKAAKRRKSFCARMSGVKGPMKDDNGKPTRKALALRKWNC